MRKILLLIYFTVVMPVIYTLFSSGIIKIHEALFFALVYIVVLILFLLLTKKKSVFSSIVNIVFIVFLVFQIFVVEYLSSVDSFVNTYGANTSKNISVITKREKKLRLEDIATNSVASMGVDDYNYYLKVANILNAKYSIEYGYSKLLNGLDNDLYEAILLSEFDVQRIRELYLNFDADYQIIKSYAISDVYSKYRNTNFSKQSYNIFLTSTNGIGNYFDSGKNNINAILTINPSRKKILVTYFYSKVAFENVCNNNVETPLNYLGFYGTACSMQSVSNKLSIPILYYLKFQFLDREDKSSSGISESKFYKEFSEEIKMMNSIGNDKNVSYILNNSTKEVKYKLDYLNLIKIFAALYRDTKSNFLQSEIKEITNSLLLSSRDWNIERQILSGSVEKNYYLVDEQYIEKMSLASKEEISKVYYRIIEFMK